MEEIIKKMAEGRASSEEINTKLLFHIGDKIAKRYNYKSLSGIEAVHYYLVNKHHWFPSHVKSLNSDDLYFCLMEEDFSFPENSDLS